jgi:cellulose synthase/poly-beta-1,6-N-acetylglucosamine synthase-like glycosyltransferase
MALAVFVVCAFLVFWTYIGYPLLLLALTARRPKRVVPPPQELPRLTVLIAARNEEDAIRDKLQNTLSLDYPRDRLQIIVASDASEDATDDIVREFADRGVELVRSPERRGKVAAQANAAQKATGEIIVFSDATGMYNPQSLRELVKHYQDPQVGCVGGVVKYRNTQDTDVTRGEGLYWRYEMWLRQLESDSGSVTIVSGPMNSVRRSVYQPGPDHASDDAWHAFSTLAKGYKVIHEPAAVVEEESVRSMEAEFSTKARIVQRNLHALWAARGLLNPLRHPFLTLRVVSHRLLRWLVPFFLIGLCVSNLHLLHSWLFQQVMGLQVIFYGLAGFGYALQRRGRRARVASLIFYFCLVNAAALVGVLRALAGQKRPAWEPVR